LLAVTLEWDLLLVRSIVATGLTVGLAAAAALLVAVAYLPCRTLAVLAALVLAG